MKYIYFGSVILAIGSALSFGGETFWLRIFGAVMFLIGLGLHLSGSQFIDAQLLMQDIRIAQLEGTNDKEIEENKS